MAQAPSDILELIAQARVTGSGVYIQHGTYDFFIKRWFYQKVQDRVVILELIVVNARAKVVYEGATKIEIEPNPPGSECSSAVNFDSEAKLSAPANARAPLMALWGFKDGEISQEVAVQSMAEVLQEDKAPATGMLLSCTTYPKEVRSRKGSYITGLQWEHIAKPGFGVNALDAVRKRIDALRVSPDEMVRVAREQLLAFRTAPLEATAASGVSTAARGVSVAAAPPPLDIPALPVAPMPVDPFAGWTVHPKSNDYYYRGSEVKTKAQLLAEAAAR